MYGTREDLCRMLSEQYPAETPLNLIIWTPADIEALSDGMEYSFSEQDVRAVLERMDAIPEEQRLESGVSASLAQHPVAVTQNKRVKGFIFHHYRLCPGYIAPQRGGAICCQLFSNARTFAVSARRRITLSGTG